LHAAPGFIDEHEVIFTELQRPLGQSSIEFLRGGEVFQIFGVSPDLKLQLTALKIVSPLIEGPHDSQHFFVVDVVVPLGVI
jgi:hypothetical protein